ncbi:MAG: 4-hydroxythreonine-4-phosphate dehydrogenase PdxA [Ignavibacteriaceae bacterium]|nr:4-hydroxythreonine-4-phosphate dehydrogenase PdxA [Ignavibacteriaceae bacterium]
MATFVFTCGDINGIGPEIAYKSFMRIAPLNHDKYIFIAPLKVVNRLQLLHGAIEYQLLKNHSEPLKKKLSIIDIGNISAEPGNPTKQSGEIAFRAIETSFALLKNGLADAVITAPISKTAINLAGINFPGHTEMYAEWCGVKNFVMTFLSKKMKAALQTIHIPLKDVAKKITQKKLTETLTVLNSMLQNDFGIKIPTIGVLGINPHAGEEGIIGKEEIEIIEPVIEKIKNKINVSGPFSPDAFFANGMEKNFNLVLGMYHDQVLIPFKQMNFGMGVNFTAGLPIVRTSPDHGTAFDIAWQGIADESSMLEALRYAKLIANNRIKKNAN